MVLPSQFNHDFFIPPQEEDETLTSHSSEALLEQVKSLTIDATKYNIRADHLSKLLAAKHHTAWAVGTKPYPPFIQSNPKL